MMKKFLLLLRDPSWQAFAAIFALIAILMSIGAEQKIAELSIIKHESISFENYMLPTDRVQLLVEGLTENLENTQATYFFITNKSPLPIHPDNYISPITIEKSKGVKRVILVESCSEKIAQSCSVIDENPSNSNYVTAFWSKDKDNKWSMSKELLNPNETTCVVVVWEKEPESLNKTVDNFSWSSRIVNVKLKVYSSQLSYYEDNSSIYDHFSLMIVFIGAGVYWLMALIVTLISLTYYLSVKSGWLSDKALISTAQTLIVTTLAICTSEIIVDIAINERPITHLPFFAYPIPFIYFLLTIYLLFKTIKTTNSRDRID